MEAAYGLRTRPGHLTVSSSAIQHFLIIQLSRKLTIQTKMFQSKFLFTFSLIKCFIGNDRDGRSRVGVYCAANACIEQVVQHGEVDVFTAVKNVRRHRPQLMENLVTDRVVCRLNETSQSHFFRSFLQTEYKYCYDLVLHYVLHYLHKEQPKK